MNMTLQAFRRLVYLYKQEVGRVVFNQYADHIGFKKEPLTVRNLMKIVDATLRLSNHRGFQAISLQDLGAATDLNAGNLHTYIRSKEELQNLVQSFGHVVSARILLDQLKDISTPLEQLRVAVRTQLFLHEVLQDWFYFSYMENRNLSAEDKQQALQTELSTEELFTNIISAGQRQGVFRDTDPQLSAALLQASVQDWFLKRWKYQQREVDVETFATFVQALFERHLLVSS
jgi:AcrR family transcriptional regulator